MSSVSLWESGENGDWSHLKIREGKLILFGQTFPRTQKVGEFNYHCFWGHKAEVKFNTIKTQVFFSLPNSKRKALKTRQFFGALLGTSCSYYAFPNLF